MDLGSKSPIYDLFLLAHIVAAIGGFGANGLAGIYAGQLYPTASDSATRYFTSPRFIAEKLIYLVPVFGLIMIGVSRGTSELVRPWVLTGIAAWIAAIAVAHSLVWPSERRIAKLIGSASEAGAVQLHAKKLARGAMILDLIFLIALVTMIVQFGGK
ncbi:MAG: hypothetical protein M0Z96_08705 [Actinomycetota bacterium]|nr:hypothetical protein [Actinomycetota bacterium]